MTPTEQRLLLRRAGFSPTPVVHKGACMTGWQVTLDPTTAEIELWPKTFNYAQSTGIVTTRSPAFDIDILNPEAAKAIEDLTRERLGDRDGRFLVRFGQRPKRAILFQTNGPFAKIQVTLDPPNGAKEQKLEFLGKENQLVAFGIHPDTGEPYAWLGGEPGAVPRDALPHISEQEARALVEEGTRLLIADYGYTIHVPGAKKQAASAPATANGQAAPFTTAPGGQPHDWLTAIQEIIDHDDGLVPLAGKLIASGMDPGAARNLLRAQLEAWTGPHDDRWERRLKEIKSAVTSAVRKKEKADQAGLPVAEKQKYTEDALALAFAERHISDLRYVAPWSQWQLFDGLVWRPDETRRFFDRSRALCRELAATCKSQRTVTALRSAKTVAAVDRLAQVDQRLVATIDQWDPVNKFFNVGDEQNGH
jgi:hypothetical protein